MANSRKRGYVIYILKQKKKKKKKKKVRLSSRGPQGAGEKIRSRQMGERGEGGPQGMGQEHGGEILGAEAAQRMEELWDRMENAWAARLNERTEKLWHRMENVWVARLNVAVEATAGRAEHLEEGMSTAISKLREEFAKRGMSPAYQPYTTGLAPRFQTTGLNGAPFLDNALVYENRDPPTFYGPGDDLHTQKTPLPTRSETHYHHQRKRDPRPREY
ncbi:hypothetical protein BDZ91DRAFT_404850 [Kalaharituber pfeilii]|nr:hypothetical protein BDZ91DRAFT_404850 [Kalaharituber pfeilii]